MAVYDAITDIFIATGAEAMPPVTDYGCWCHPQFVDSRGYMVPYLSVKWYIEHGLETSRRRLNAQRVMAAFRNEPWRRREALGDHYDVLLVDQPIFDPAEEEHFGLTTTPAYTVDGIAVLISTYHIDRLERVAYSLLKTLAMREMAHAFGVPGLRREALELTPRIACTNPCILGPCTDMPDDLERLTDLRLDGPPFCDICLAGLQANLSPNEKR